MSHIGRFGQIESFGAWFDTPKTASQGFVDGCFFNSTPDGGRRLRRGEQQTHQQYEHGGATNEHHAWWCGRATQRFTRLRKNPGKISLDSAIR
jgi:hypothetical protein